MKTVQSKYGTFLSTNLYLLAWQQRTAEDPLAALQEMMDQLSPVGETASSDALSLLEEFFGRSRMPTEDL